MTERARILVVDDDPGMRRALQRILAPSYDVEAVAGTTGALARLGVAGVAGAAGAAGADGGAAEPRETGDGGEADFALALIDVRLADGDGYSLCQMVRERRPQTDVILITGSLSQPDDKLYRSLEEGAFYFLFKPFERRVLLALVERCLRLQRERTAKERFALTLADDLERARRFQLSLLPREALCAMGWRLEGRLVSCDALGGDFYLAHAGDDALVVAVSDVVGHGVSAAMYAGMLRSTLDAARRRGPEPREMIGELLDGIDFFAGAKYATMFYGLLSPGGKVSYVNAGHPPALWQRTSATAAIGATGATGATGAIEPLAATGFFLSTAFRSRPHSPGEIVMSPGERLLIYTDGASEACAPGGAELGSAGLAAALEEYRGLSLADTLDALLGRIREHCGGRPLDDDVTLVLVERADLPVR
jgi:sigma-B regulation protein RsbU (phosphoserine phosphatase)